MVDHTAGCIDTGLPVGRRYFGQSDKPFVETAIVHHARWVMFIETRCRFIKAYSEDLLPGPSCGPYSPKCLEGAFCVHHLQDAAQT
jgi:hypothetical protein